MEEQKDNEEEKNPKIGPVSCRRYAVTVDLC